MPAMCDIVFYFPIGELIPKFNLMSLIAYNGIVEGFLLERVGGIVEYLLSFFHAFLGI